jgi:hypothetical protein
MADECPKKGDARRLGGGDKGSALGVSEGLRLRFSSLGLWRIGGLKPANTSTALLEPDPHAVETNTDARGRGRSCSS